MICNDLRFGEYSRNRGGGPGHDDLKPGALFRESRILFQERQNPVTGKEEPRFRKGRTLFQERQL